MRTLAALTIAVLSLVAAAADVEKGDAYIRRRAETWVIGNSTVEKTLQLSGGNLTLTSFRNKVSGREYIQAGVASREIRFLADGESIFVVPAKGRLSISGEIRKDPSAENGRPAAARILHTSRQIWPASGWAKITPHYDQKLPYQIDELPVAAGDTIRFVLKHSGLNAADPVVWDPVVVVTH